MVRGKSTLGRGLILVALAIAGCAPPPAQNRPVVGSSVVETEAQRVPKNLSVAIIREPSSLHQDLSPGLTTSGNKQLFLVPHNFLAVRDDSLKYIPQLAVEMISVDKGTWRVNADGTMDTTWKLRPNVKWHDGAPFTADDIVFAFGVYKDPDIPNQVGGVLRSMASVEAADPQTLVVHWSAIYAEADAAFGLVPLPKHLLEQVYRTDKASFINSPLLSTEFVGLGAYKLNRWDPGAQIEFVRFDQYYLGRPPLDSIVVRFLNDPNVMGAAILAEGVDVLLPTSVDIETAVEIKRRWEGTGNQVTVSPNGAMILLLIQHRQEYARPRNGFTNQLVRQGFLNATDREAVAEVAVVGLGPVADSWFPPTHELYPRVRDAIPQYPYDLSLAQQRLQQAGWVKNAQGELISQQTGERFEVELRTPPGLAGEKTLATTADGWTKVGAKAEFNFVPAALSSDAEYRVTLPGLSVTGQIFDMFYQNVHDSREIGNASNRWVGSNRSGYANLKVDDLYDKLKVAIAPSERLVLHRALLQEVMGDVAFLPLYWQLAPVLSLKGVHGIRGTIDNSNTWNVFEWTKD